MTVKAKIRPRRFISKEKYPPYVQMITRIKPAKAMKKVRRFRAKAANLLFTRITQHFLNSDASLDLSVCN